MCTHHKFHWIFLTCRHVTSNQISWSMLAILLLLLILILIIIIIIIIIITTIITIIIIYYHYYYCYYYIDRRIYINLSKSTQSAAVLKPFEACCQWALLNVKIMTLLFTFSVYKYICHLVSKVHDRTCRVSVIHRTLTWTTWRLTCVRDHSSACVYTRGVGHTGQRVSTTLLTRK